MLLGCQAAEDLGVVTFAFGIHQESVAELLNQYQDVFEGIGCLRHKEVKLHIDKTVQPVAIRDRRIAFHLRPQVEKELSHLEEAGIIERCGGATNMFLRIGRIERSRSGCWLSSDRACPFQRLRATGMMAAGGGRSLVRQRPSAAMRL
ncbi:hypothetical protein NDU88_001702 [Pleurodeles waltl]|uniref:Uncharacterized protein n=1 Tax=Pleurodeles waltl TaxID=8319 RepID=A0AAV7U8T7_PLEWA|nr:hypothetical protein NDU88_001702 [Pleurodeles waltl]